MSDTTKRRSFARMLQRVPWLVRAAYPFYQLTRARFTMGVVGILLDSEQRVLLAEHVYHPRVPWGVPGGAVSTGEDPADALIREYREELAMPVTIVAPLIVERTYFRHVDIAFLCRSDATPVVSSAELLDAQWFRRDNLPAITKFQQRALTRAYALADIESRLAQ